MYNRVSCRSRVCMEYKNLYLLVEFCNEECDEVSVEKIGKKGRCSKVLEELIYLNMVNYYSKNP